MACWHGGASTALLHSSGAAGFWPPPHGLCAHKGVASTPWLPALCRPRGRPDSGVHGRRHHARRPAQRVAAGRHRAHRGESALPAPTAALSERVCARGGGGDTSGDPCRQPLTLPHGLPCAPAVVCQPWRLRNRVGHPGGGRRLLFPRVRGRRPRLPCCGAAQARQPPCTAQRSRKSGCCPAPCARHYIPASRQLAALHRRAARVPKHSRH